MEISVIQELYDIGEVLFVSEPATGSGDSIIITSTMGKFVYKNNQRLDFLEVVKRANSELMRADIAINNVLCSVNGNLIEIHNAALFTFIEGESKIHLQREESRRALKYMAKLNEVLRNIDVNTISIENLNYWDLSKSLEYITTTFYSDLMIKDESQKNNLILNAVELLHNRYTELKELPIQVIHSDLGPEHFLFNISGDICGVIDFTPDIKSEYHCLAQYIYWNHLWNNYEVDKIEEHIGYYINYSKPVISLELSWLIILEVAVSRYVGRLLYLEDQESSLDDYSLDKRFEIVALVKAKCI